MPYSPVPMFPEIVRELNRMGHKKKTPYYPLRIAVIKTTGLVNDKTIKNTIKIMEDLGFVKIYTEGGIQEWKICINAVPYKFYDEWDEDQVNRIVKSKKRKVK